MHTSTIDISFILETKLTSQVKEKKTLTQNPSDLHSSFCFYSPGPQQDICVANFHSCKSKAFGDHERGNYQIIKNLGRGAGQVLCLEKRGR